MKLSSKTGVTHNPAPLFTFNYNGNISDSQYYVILTVMFNKSKLKTDRGTTRTTYLFQVMTSHGIYIVYTLQGNH